LSLWIRLYREVLDDPKVQTLPEAMFKTWINLLLVAAQHDGALPDTAAVAFALRLPEKEAARRIVALVEIGLLDREGDVLRPHNWDARQYKSDSSTERSKRFRENKSNVAATAVATADRRENDSHGDVAETPNATASERQRDGPRNVAATAHATPPETETESEKERSSSSSSTAPTRRRIDDDDLFRQLKKAAKGHIESTCCNVKPIKGLIEKEGFDLKLDILPIVAATVPRLAKPLQKWGPGRNGDWWLYDEIAAWRRTRVALPAGAPAVPVGYVFFEPDSPEWPAWAAVWRRKNGKASGPPAVSRNPKANSPMGWYFTRDYDPDAPRAVEARAAPAEAAE
jgi:hypothetical protein